MSVVLDEPKTHTIVEEYSAIQVSVSSIKLGESVSLQVSLGKIGDDTLGIDEFIMKRIRHVKITGALYDSWTDDDDRLIEIVKENIDAIVKNNSITLSEMPSVDVSGVSLDISGGEV